MIIETHEEHTQMLALLDILLESPRSEVDGPWMDVLAKAIDAYELIHFPIPEPTPEEQSAFRRAEGGPICAEKGHAPGMDPQFCARCHSVLREK